VLLLDEPFGALDPITRERVQGSFRRIQRQLGLTALFVTHDMAEALMLGDRVAVMREGHLLQVGTGRELLHAPADPYVEELVRAPLRQARAVEALLEGTP
jgi:osmoprotectant transport system ATP-binding protein